MSTGTTEPATHPTVEALMSGLFLGGHKETGHENGCLRVVRTVEAVAREVVREQDSRGGYEPDDDDDDGNDYELEPAEHWHRCLDLVRGEWERWKAECPSLHPWYRREGRELDNRLHLQDVLERLGDSWRARDFLLGLLMETEERQDPFTNQQADLRPMALYMLALVRAEELEAEGLRVTRAVRARHGDEAGLPEALEGLLGGQRSVQWWLRESESQAEL